MSNIDERVEEGDALLFEQVAFLGERGLHGGGRGGHGGARTVRLHAHQITSKAIDHREENEIERLLFVVHIQQVMHVRNAEPIWDPAPTILSEVKLDIEETPRPERDLADFKLSSAIRRLMRQLDHIQEGKIEKIEVREGIPRRLMLSGLVQSTALPAGPPMADPV